MVANFILCLALFLIIMAAYKVVYDVRHPDPKGDPTPDEFKDVKGA